MQIGEEKYYSITNFKKIKKENINSSIKEFDTFDEAMSFPNTDIIVTKKRLENKNEPGTGFTYPNVYSYKITNLKKEHFFIEYGNCKSADSKIFTKRSGNYYEPGSGIIEIYDRNNYIRSIQFSAEFDNRIDIVGKLIEFLIDFHSTYSADWKFYQIKNENDIAIQELKQNLEKVTTKLIETQHKLKLIRSKLKKNSDNK